MITAESTIEKSVEQGSRRSRRHVARYVGAVAVTSLAAIFAAGAGGGSKLERSTVDRPDDITGEQVHFIYATPNGTDLMGDTNGQVEKVIDDIQSFLDTRGEQGLGLRVDTYQSRPDISYFPLKQTQEEIMAIQPIASASFLLSIIEQVHGSFNNPNKNYQVFLDGNISGNICDPGRLYGDRLGVTYLNKTGCNYTYNGVNTLALTTTNNILNTEGYAKECAANFVKNGQINDPEDPFDLLSPQKASEWWKIKLDTNHNDYLRAPNCPGIESSRLFTWLLKTATRGNGEIVPSEKPDNDKGAYLSGSRIELSTKPEKGWSFRGWEGDCSGREKCSLLMDKAHNVIANFIKESVTPPPPPKTEYKVDATIEGPGRFKYLRKLGKHIVATFNKKGVKVVLKVIPDNKNVVIQNIVGCDNQELGMPPAKMSGLCIEIVDHKIERIMGKLVKVPVINKRANLATK